jgi:hypothetical protein
MVKKSASVLSLVVLSALPSFAATRVYIPVVAGADGTVRGTRISLSNYGEAESRYDAVIASADESQAWRDRVPLDRAVEFSPPQAGLLKLDVGAGVTVDAWLSSETQDGATHYSRLPVVDEFSRFAAASRAYFNGLGREEGSLVPDLAIVNFDKRAAACAIAAFRDDRTAIGGLAELRVAADSERRFADILAAFGENFASGVTVEVSCDTSFFAYATLRRGTAGPVSVVAPTRTLTAPALVTCPLEATQAYCYEAAGQFHAPDRGNEKAILRFPVTAAINIKKLTISFDVVVGPWNSKNRSGAHSPLWLHRGKFRSNTVGNINFFGPNKNFTKFNQNIGLPAGSNTKAQIGLVLEPGHTYRLVYSYAPQEGKTARLQILENGVVLRTIEARTTSGGSYLDIPASGLVGEFGHNRGQHPPEVDFPKGWLFLNLLLVENKL